MVLLAFHVPVRWYRWYRDSYHAIKHLQPTTVHQVKCSCQVHVRFAAVMCAWVLTAGFNAGTSEEFMCAITCSEKKAVTYSHDMIECRILLVTQET